MVYLAPLGHVPLGAFTLMAGLSVDRRPDRIAVGFRDDVAFNLAPERPLTLTSRPATHRTLIIIIHCILKGFFFLDFNSFFVCVCGIFQDFYNK